MLVQTGGLYCGVPRLKAKGDTEEMRDSAGDLRQVSLIHPPELGVVDHIESEGGEG